jgi:hypothetical protein
MQSLTSRRQSHIAGAYIGLHIFSLHVLLIFTYLWQKLLASSASLIACDVSLVVSLIVQKTEVIIALPFSC